MRSTSHKGWPVGHLPVVANPSVMPQASLAVCYTAKTSRPFVRAMKQLDLPGTNACDASIERTIVKCVLQARANCAKHLLIVPTNWAEKLQKRM